MLTPLKTTISTRSGAIGTELTFEVQENNLVNVDKECRAHFSVPPSKWWDDVKFACGTIHLFSSHSEALAWSEKHGFYKGECLDIRTLWELSKVLLPTIMCAKLLLL